MRTTYEYKHTYDAQKQTCKMAKEKNLNAHQVTIFKK
jgi:hypothetical protein